MPENITGNNDPMPPDAPELRMGSGRLMSIRHEISVLMEKIQRARESDDLVSARDYCLEWLLIDPESEKALEILEAIETALNVDREHLLLVRRAKDLLAVGHVLEAMDLLERLPVESGYSRIARHLILKARAKLVEIENDRMSQMASDEIFRLLDGGQPEEARKRYDDLCHIAGNDFSFLKTKIDRALEIQETEKKLILRLSDALDRHDMEHARIWLGMIVQLNPETGVFDMLRKTLEPERYENLTSQITIT